MATEYDLIVIGTGVASSIANQCRQQGWSVAVADHRPFGGTCALRGCTPKKVLTYTASLTGATARLSDKTLSKAPVTIDWPALMQFKTTFTDATPATTERGYEKQGIDSYHGRARFVDPQTIAVGKNVMRGRFIVIAAGAEPVPLPVDGAEHLATSDDFLSLADLPERLVFVGGGYVAFECAHVAARAGAAVTILHRGERPLEGFEPELVDWLLQRTREVGVEVRLGHEVTGIELRGSGYWVQCNNRQTFAGDRVIHSAGRAPALDALAPEAGDVAMEDGRIALSEYLQSISNPRVYAAGDAAAQGPMLTPVAAADAGVVVANLQHGNRCRPDYTGVPSVVFCEPPLARVGMSEQEARRDGLDVEVRCRAGFPPATRVRAARASRRSLSAVAGRFLGAHLLGPAADEVINLFALAIRQGITADRIEDTIMVFPTAAHDIKSML